VHSLFIQKLSVRFLNPQEEPQLAKGFEIPHTCEREGLVVSVEPDIFYHPSKIRNPASGTAAGSAA
jgi:hypothetical protein